MKLTIDVAATDGAARTGTIRTPRGVLPTPLFMPVGTRAAVKTLDSADLEALGIPLILGNTYHLMLRPGAELIGELGGLHRFMDWSGHVLTDSGGYQIFSLEPKVTDDGATFRSTYDGTTHHLTPEGQRVAIFYTKVHDRLLGPLLAADQPPAPLELRRALATIDRHVVGYADSARLAKAA